MKRVVFFSVVFPAVEPYLHDYFTSLKNQSVKNFDVFIVNDGLSNFEKYRTQYSTLDILSVDYHNTPAKIREYGINQILTRDYSAVIFGDADDFFAPNRIETAIAFLNDWDIVVNDLDLVDSNNHAISPNYISARIENRKTIKSDFIRDKNIFGLSNTAVKISALPPARLNENLLAVDWYLFSLLLLNNCTSIFTNETTTSYRQYTGNAAGLGVELTKERFLKTIKVKSLHYQELATLDYRYKKLHSNIILLESKLHNNDQYLDYCMNYLKSNKISYPVWWEDITPLERVNEN